MLIILAVIAESCGGDGGRGGIGEWQSMVRWEVFKSLMKFLLACLSLIEFTDLALYESSYHVEYDHPLP